MATHLFEILKQLQFGHSQIEGIGLFAGFSWRVVRSVKRYFRQSKHDTKLKQLLLHSSFIELLNINVHQSGAVVLFIYRMDFINRF